LGEQLSFPFALTRQTNSIFTRKEEHKDGYVQTNPELDDHELQTKMHHQLATYLLETGINEDFQLNNLKKKFLTIINEYPKKRNGRLRNVRAIFLFSCLDKNIMSSV